MVSALPALTPDGEEQRRLESLGRHSRPEAAIDQRGAEEGSRGRPPDIGWSRPPARLHLANQEALLGPAGSAYSLRGIVTATDGSLKKSGAMGVAMVSKDNRIQSRSVAVYGPLSSIRRRPELTGISLAVEDCPIEEDLNILTDSLSALQLLRGMQRKDPLWLHRHTARHLLVQVVRQINQRAAAGSIMRLIEVQAHRAEPQNEAADTLTAEATEADDSRPIELDLDPEAVHFCHRGKWAEWDARVREDLVQRQQHSVLHTPFGEKRETLRS